MIFSILYCTNWGYPAKSISENSKYSIDAIFKILSASISVILSTMTQQMLTCSNSIIETLEKVKYVRCVPS